MKNTKARRRSVLRQAPLPTCLSAALAAGLVTAVSGSAGQLDLSRPWGVPLVVTSCADDGSAGTLRSVVATAVSGDVLDLTALSCGTITLLSGQIEVQVDELTFEGPGADSLTIDGNHGEDDYYIANGRVFNDVGTQNLTINNVTIANGLVFNPYTLAYGGCINAKGPVVMNNVVVTGCRAVTCQSQAGGGGIASSDASGAIAGGISLLDSVVTGNEAISKFCPAWPLYSFASSGGGIASRGPITVTNSLITNNQVHTYAPADASSIPFQAAGGGIMAYFAPLTITGSVVSNNFAGCHTGTELCYNAVGAGIRALGGVTIESTSVSGNIAEGKNVLGAGIELENGLNQQLIFQISNSTISDNQGVNGTVRNWGGGVEAEYDVAIEISNSTIDGNTASLGGGIHVEGAQMTLSNTTVSGNTAGIAGGGVYVQAYAEPLLTLQNSTITLNRSSGSSGGGGVVDASGQTGVTVLQSSILAGNINDVTGTTYDADLGAVNGSVTGANNLIIAAGGVTLPPDTLSGDPLLGPLQDNGGPTWTHALDPASPAIDAGNNLANLDFDQRGEGFLRVYGSAADIGAFEYQPAVVDEIFSNGFDGASP
jgi:hypothetical protein